MTVILNWHAVLVPEISERGLPSHDYAASQAMCWRTNQETGLSPNDRCRPPFIATDGRRIVPRLTVNVGAGHHAGSAGSDARRGRGKMNSVRKKLRVNVNVSGSRWQGVSTTINERATGIIGVWIGSSGEIAGHDAIAEVCSVNGRAIPGTIARGGELHD